jgi:hypothetical protein
MAKPSITTRATKGSALTWTEGDNNFTNLQNATVTLQAGTGGTNVVSDLNGTVTLVAGTNITLAGDNTAKTVTITGSGGGASTLNDLTDVTISGSPMTGQVIKWSSATSQWTNQSDAGIDGLYADPNPSLGGNLTVMGYSIVSAAAGDIAITPNSTGNIVLDGQKWPQADGTANQVLKTDGAGQLSWTTAGGGISDVVADTSPQLGGDLDVNTRKIVSTSNGAITIQPDGTGDVELVADTVKLGDANATATVTTNGTGDLVLRTNNASTSGDITISNGTNGNITLSPNGTGHVAVSTNLQLNAQGDLRFADSDSSNYVGFQAPTTVSTNKIWTLPGVDGSSGQVLSTDGAGILSWATAGGGITYLRLSVSSSSPETISGTNGEDRRGALTEGTDTSSIFSITGGGYTISWPAGSYVCFWNYNTSTSPASVMMYNVTDDANIFGVFRTNNVNFFNITSTKTVDFRWTNNGFGASVGTLHVIKVA